MPVWPLVLSLTVDVLRFALSKATAQVRAASPSLLYRYHVACVVRVDLFIFSVI